MKARLAKKIMSYEPHNERWGHKCSYYWHIRHVLYNQRISFPKYSVIDHRIAKAVIMTRKGRIKKETRQYNGN